MLEQVNTVRRIGACENSDAQTEWSGPAITPCTAPAFYLCTTCGHVLCGGHAGGHAHPAGDAVALPTRLQDQVSVEMKRSAMILADKARVEADLETARKDCRRIQQIKAILADPAPAAPPATATAPASDPKKA